MKSIVTILALFFFTGSLCLGQQQRTRGHADLGYPIPPPTIVRPSQPDAEGMSFPDQRLLPDPATPGQSVSRPSLELPQSLSDPASHANVISSRIVLPNGWYVVERVYQTWNDTTDTWRNQYKYSYTYDSHGRTIELIQQLWVSSAWLNQYRVAYSYDADGRSTNTFTRDGRRIIGRTVSEKL